jgi:hypothetical protein
MEVEQVERDMENCNREHKAALAAAGAARASKDAILRDYVATAAQLQAANEPQNDWEANALASLRLYRQKHRTLSRAVGTKEGQIVVMDAQEYEAMQQAAQASEAKMQGLKVELVDCRNIIDSLRQRLLASQSTASAASEATSTSVSCPHSFGPSLPAMESGEQPRHHRQEKRESRDGDEPEKEQRMGWGVLIMDENACVHNLKSSAVPANSVSQNLTTDLSSGSPLVRVDACEGQTDGEGDGRDERGMFMAVNHLSPIARSITFDSSPNAGPGQSTVHATSATSASQADTLSAIVAAATQDNLEGFKDQAALHNGSTSCQMLPDHSHPEPCGYEYTGGMRTPEKGATSAYDAHTQTPAHGGSVAISTPPTVKRCPKGCAAGESMRLRDMNKLLKSSGSNASVYALAAAGHIYTLGGKGRGRVDDGRGGSGFDGLQCDTHGFDKDAFDQGLSRLEAQTHLVFSRFVCCVPCSLFAPSRVTLNSDSQTSCLPIHPVCIVGLLNSC